MQNKKFVAALLLLPLLYATAAWGEPSAYLTLVGSKQGILSGESADAGYKDAIIVLGFKFSSSLPFDESTGLLTGAQKHEPLTIIKKIDSASPLLLQAFASNESMKKFELNLVRINSAGKPETYYRIELKNALIVELEDTMLNAAESAFSNYPHMEEVTFAFQQMKVTHLPSNREAIIDWSVRD